LTLIIIDMNSVYK